MLNLRQSQLQNEFVALNEIRIIFQFAEHTARPKHNQLNNNRFSYIDSNDNDRPLNPKLAAIPDSTCGKTTPNDYYQIPQRYSDI